MSATAQNQTVYGLRDPVPMRVREWKSVGTVDPGSLGEARRQAHNLVQWLARLSHSYIARSEPEAKRLALRWHPDYPAMVTREFVGRLGLEIRFPTLVMQFTEEGRPVLHKIEPEQRSPAEIEAWILVELLHRGVDRSLFSKRLPYQIPDLMSGDAHFYSLDARAPELGELCAWFQNAAAVLELVGTEAKEKFGFESEIRCWPHDLHMTNVLGNGDPDGGGIRLGFSPGDPGEPEPFFYASRTAGRRHESERRRSVLRASKLLASANPFDELRDFFGSLLSADRSPAPRRRFTLPPS